MSIATPALQYSVNGGSVHPIGGASISIPAGSTLVVSLVSTSGLSFAAFNVSSPNSGLNGASAYWNGQGSPSITLFFPPAGGSIVVNVSVSDGQNTAAALASFFSASTVNAQDSSGTSVASAASASAYLEYNCGDPGFGTLVGGVNTLPVATANRQAITAAVAAGIADLGRRDVVLPRSTALNGTYAVDQPITICPSTNASTSTPLRFGGENRGVGLRAFAYIGDVVIASAPITAPTPVANGNFWGTPFNAGVNIYFDRCPSMSLNGLGTFSIICGVKLSSSSDGGIIASWNGTNAFGIAPTSAFRLLISNTGTIGINWTTAIAGAGSLSGATTLSLNTFYWVEANFDGTHWRIMLNGVQDAISTLGATDTITQGYETIVLGGQATLWPYGQISGLGPTGYLYNPQVYDHILPGHTSTYSVPTTETTTTVDGTMIVLSFAPTAALGQPWNGTSAVNAVGSIVGVAQKNVAGVQANCPVWLLWQSQGGGSQGIQVYLHDFSVSAGTAGCADVLVQLLPNARVERVDAARITLLDNTYLSVVKDCNGNSTTSYGALGPHTTPKSWQTATLFGGPMDLDLIQGVGGDVGLILRGSGKLGRSYILPDGDFQMIVQSPGSQVNWEFSAWNGGDEAHATAKASILFTSGAIGNLLSNGVTATQGSTSFATTADLSSQIPAGTQFVITSHADVIFTVQSITSSTITTTQPWPFANAASLTARLVPAYSTLCVRMGGTGQVLNNAAQGLFWIDGGTDYVFDNFPWISAQAGSYVFKFINPPDGLVTVRGAQITDNSAGTPCPWMPATGSSGQGLVYVENQQSGRVRKYACPDSNYTLLPNEFTWGSLAPIGVLTATRTHTVPLIAGYRWLVDNTLQTGTPQSVTYKCLSDPGSGVTVAAGKKAWIAVHDVTVGLVRETLDT